MIIFFTPCMFHAHLKWCRMPLRARPSAQLVVKFSTLTSGYERVHWRTQLSKIFSLLVCCRLAMMSFIMSFTCMEKHQKKWWNMAFHFSFFTWIYNAVHSMYIQFIKLTQFSIYWRSMAFVDIKNTDNLINIPRPATQDKSNLVKIYMKYMKIPLF